MNQSRKRKRLKKPSYWVGVDKKPLCKWFESGEKGTWGFLTHNRGLVKKIKEADYILVFWKAHNAFTGLLKVTSPYVSDDTDKSLQFPCRVGVECLVALRRNTAIPFHSVSDKLRCCIRPKREWGLNFRPSPNKWIASDGRLVKNAIRRADRNPLAQ